MLKRKKKYSNADNQKGNMQRYIQRYNQRVDSRQSPTGWFPTNLSPEDKKLYDRYRREFGTATNTWADGSPRNPMPEIRNQYKK